MTSCGHLIPLSDRRAWEEALSGIAHAFAHTWQSCHAMQLTTGWQTHLYCYAAGETRFVCPIAEREFAGQIDAVTPYGFSGFAGRGDVPELLEAWNRFARRQSYVCGYIALNPLLTGNDFDAAEDLTYSNELFFLDLSQSEDALLNAMQRNRRRPIRRWQQEGSPLVVDRSLLVPFFLKQFRPFMESRGASETYRFSQETLLELINGTNSIMIGAADEGILEAVSLFCSADTIGEAMFSISAAGGRRHADVLMWAGAMELKRRNIRWMSLGGGITRQDSVAAVKSGYGALSLRMPVLRQIYDQHRFAELCRIAGVNPNSRSGYFPPYRRGSAIVR